MDSAVQEAVQENGRVCINAQKETESKEVTGTSGATPEVSGRPEVSGELKR